MPTWDKKTKSFKGRVRISGHPQATKTGFRTREDAKRWELNTKHALKNNQPIPQTPTQDLFSQASSNYIRWCEDHKYKPGTIDTKLQIFRDFVTHLKFDPDIHDIDQDTIEDYMRSRKRAKTANRHRRELNTFFNWMIKKDYLDINPCAKVEKYREKKYYPYVPPAEDVNKVLLLADDFQYDFLQTIYHLSARRGEVMKLRWDDVNFKTKTVYLWTSKRQGGELERDTLKMNSTLEGILKDRYKEKTCEWVFHDNGRELTRTKIEGIVKRLCKKAGVKHFNFHALRHHVAALMAASKKLSLIDIQRQLRHKLATTTNTYLTGLVNDSNAADIIAEMQTKTKETKIVPIRKKK